MSENINFIKNAIQNLRFSSIVEILLVAYLLYRLYSLIRETRAEQLVKGLLILLALIPVSYALNLTMIYTILSGAVTVGLLSIVIIFQPEIRRALEHIGRTAFKDTHLIGSSESYIALEELCTAIDNLASTKTGALIAIEQNTMLGEILNSGTEIDAKVTAPLVENIFFPNTPLHDGAMVIRDYRIKAAGCVLPLTNTLEISKKLGTRHRAGIGLTEVSDAAVIIVSEETGVISLALNGKLVRNYDKERLLAILTKILNKKTEEKNITLREKVITWMKQRKMIS